MTELEKNTTEVLGQTPAQMREDVVFRAIESEAVQEAVSGGKGKADTIKRVRLVLEELFPEVKKIPREDDSPEESIVGNRMKNPRSLPMADLLIAKDIIALLKED